MHKSGIDFNDGTIHGFGGNGRDGRSQASSQVGQLWGKACFGDEHDDFSSWNVGTGRALVGSLVG